MQLVRLSKSGSCGLHCHLDTHDLRLYHSPSKVVLTTLPVRKLFGLPIELLAHGLHITGQQKEKFRVLRETILSRQEVDLQMLQRFAGKTTSFSIAVPVARLYTRTFFRAIGFHGKRPNRP